ncbi:copper chaperone PCu(A)C [Aurantimonas sp. VKM B-3413]|uniref:copper chaperone PCu(A)C n=1 Tax=Aurantimonas sp. VKM B-3413 TaxID=2779401 RepID=UPI001E2A27DF|nr:copper chaperone PCu(A)C [Aurantimonas sp. VKM B-3413]MCB8839230.1 copper chaperone PCu(A)C [Aurantimonas sp. VKM B-3413]
MALIQKLALGAFMTLATASGAAAHEYKAGAITIGHPWARATLPNAPVAGGYMTIDNTGSEADRLIGGSTPAAKAVEVHEMSVDGGVMKMRQLPDGLEIPAGQSVTLKPGSYHLMLIGPTERLTKGMRVPLTLKFEKAGSVAVELAVEDVATRKPEMAGDHDAMSGMHAGQPGTAAK